MHMPAGSAAVLPCSPLTGPAYTQQKTGAHVCAHQGGCYGEATESCQPGAGQDREGLVKVEFDQGEKMARMVRAADGLRVGFGLRAKESLMSSKVETRNGKQYLTIEGAKGGRPRELAARTETQIKALQGVAETARDLGSGTGRIIPP